MSLGGMQYLKKKIFMELMELVIQNIKLIHLKIIILTIKNITFL